MTMRITMLRTAAGAGGFVPAGACCDILDVRGTELVAKNFAIATPSATVTAAFIVLPGDVSQGPVPPPPPPGPSGLPANQGQVGGGSNQGNQVLPPGEEMP